MPVTPARREAVGRNGSLLEALHPIDGLLDHRIEALHAKACPIDAAIGQRVDHRRREPARVNLDGNLGCGKDKERVCK
jgi:hypothetical protein